MSHHEEHDHEHDDAGSEETIDPIQHFWGTTVQPESEYTVSLERSELHLTNALLVSGGAATVYLSTARLKEPVAIVSLGAGAKHALLDLEVFPDDEAATFRVEGTGAVALSGSIAIFGGELVVDSEDEEEGEGEEEASALDAAAAAKAGQKAKAAAAATKKAAAVAAAVEGSDEEDEESDGAEDDEFDEDDEDDEEGDDDAESEELDSDDDAVKDDGEEDEDEGEDEGEDDQTALASAIQKLQAAKRKRDAEAAKPAAAAKTAEQPAAKKAAAPAQPEKKQPAAVPQQQPAAKKAKTEAPAPAPAAAAKPAASLSKAEIATADTGLQKLADGMVQFRDIRVGSGPTPAKGSKVTVAYVGKLTNGKVFDSSNSFSFRLGVGSVIRGWDVGVAGMRPGGKRSLVIHPAFGYGKKGAMPDIPPHATLLFDVELLKC